jgi:hypothetical protein
MERPTLEEELRSMANFLRRTPKLPGIPVARLLDQGPCDRIAGWLDMLADRVEGDA